MLLYNAFAPIVITNPYVRRKSNSYSCITRIFQKCPWWQGHKLRSVCGSSPVSPLLCLFCPHGNSKTTQTCPSKASGVFLLLSLSLASFWEVPGCRNGGTCACCSLVCTPRDSSMLSSSPGEKCLLKRQSEQSLYSQWELAVSGRIPGCKYSFFKDLISCYVLMWLLEWFWKRKRLQQGFASKLDIIFFLV